jgi:hypothetical protein
VKDNIKLDVRDITELTHAGLYDRTDKIIFLNKTYHVLRSSTTINFSKETPHN